VYQTITDVSEVYYKYIRVHPKHKQYEVTCLGCWFNGRYYEIYCRLCFSGLSKYFTPLTRNLLHLKQSTD